MIKNFDIKSKKVNQSPSISSSSKSDRLFFWAIVAVAVFGLGSFVLGWSNPTTTPPGGNIPAPINVSTTTQTKAGSLNISGSVGIGTTSPSTALEVVGTVKMTGFQLATSTASGYVLTSDANGVGSWQSAGGSSSVSALEADFTAGANVTAGDVVSLRHDGTVAKGLTVGTTNPINQVAALDSTHFVAVYKGPSSYIYAIACSTSGTTITCGQPYNSGTVTQATANYEISIAALDSTHFVIAYKDTNIRGSVIVGLTDGATAISSFGSTSQFNEDRTLYDLSIATLDSTHFVVVYKDLLTNYPVKAIIGATSGTSISGYGSIYSLSNSLTTSALDYPSVAKLDSTHFVAIYADLGNSNYGTAIVCVTSGTTISSCGAENVYNSADTREYQGVAALDSTHFVVAYENRATYQGVARIGLVSGTTISSYGAANTYESVYAFDNDVAALDSTHFAVSYNQTDNSTYFNGTGIIGLTDGATTISSYGAKNSFETKSSGTQVDQVSNSILDSTHFVTTYLAGSTGPAYAVVGLTSGTTISSYGNKEPFAATRPFIGIAKQTKSAGQTVTVTIAGISSVHSSLTTGDIYYADTSGNLSITASSYRVGIAASSTTLILDSNRDNTDQFFGDLVFANSFRITEASGLPGALIFKNQFGKNILTLDENGNLAVSGDITLWNNFGVGKMLKQLQVENNVLRLRLDALESAVFRQN